MKKLNRLGEKYTTNEGYEVEITKYISNGEVEVTFENGFKVECQFIRIKKGKIKNPYHKSVHGVGFFGAGNYRSINDKISIKSYKTWTCMIKRCYDKKEQDRTPTYKGVTVCEEWHNFQNFAEWFENNFNPEYMESWHLDKDIICNDCKIYSPDTCCFVPHEINMQFTERTRRYLTGISKAGKSFAVQISINGKKIFLGHFKTIKEASFAYQKARKECIKTLAEKYKSKLPEQVYQALINYQVQIIY